MTMYGTIAKSPSPLGANLEYISHANQRPRPGVANQRPWKDMLNRHLFASPTTLEETIGRLITNLDHFLTNYAVVMLAVLFLGLFWHPLSLLVLTATMAPWLFFYFCRDKRLVIYDYIIDDRMVMFVLSAITIVFLLLTGATMNVTLSLLFGVVLVLVHAVFRKIDNLFVDEEALDVATTFLPQK